MYKMSSISLMSLNKLASWLGFMFEAICLPLARKFPSSNVVRYILHASQIT